MSNKLYTILVPADFPIEHHKEWDTEVRNISGGLTILNSAKGQWINKTKDLIEEKVIPVMIACDETDIWLIVLFTKTHYKQEKVMYWVTSQEVFLV